MIIVAGHLRVAPADRERLVSLSCEAVRLARATRGCHDFAVAADPVDADRVNVYERWADRGTMQAFRGEGPRADIGALILDATIDEFEV